MRKFAYMFVVFGLAVGLGVWLNQSPQTAALDQEFALPFAANAQSSDADAGAAEIIDMVQGAEDAPITVIEYASFTCPHCARFHSDVYKLLRKNYIDTGKVKFIFREVYFDKYGMWASMIARCSGPDRFFGMTDLILNSQSTWARAGDDLAIVEALRKIGRLSGMQDAALDSCLQDGEKLRALVGWYKENAQRDGIQSTPSFLIDGQPYKNMDYEEFAKILDEKL
ncbi:Disulfide bond formation protein D precursor [Rhodobacteraceae bacterium SB2]|jgi:protein-disulfide isomerase|nr:DsbA family protein [Paracoccaceae bacterium]OAH08879.1 Disulfide bond formation protein D precursor [Rhodobacteraceae bacterium SB2]WQC63480.1 DsbA family protein [Alphaproteobacteria bacterium US3C007]MDA8578257.1 DsbA family protein [Paracoccaceae bacterium]MDA9943439.1 DsbA family protein [Paracoccaceae bacterium]|tara:strand:+ start:1056 stop:1730 length:675 start_codon:yes stop_codon:yes gene_type:complete